MWKQHHPNVHSEWQPWSEEETLHVVCCYINPFRWRTRRHLMNDFIRHMLHSHNVKLYVVEVQFGERPWEFKFDDAPYKHIGLRAKDAIWLKENALNLGMAQLSEGWKYAAYIDADFTFTRHDWALEAIHLLQLSPWVQLFSQYGDLSANTYGGNLAQTINKSFAATYIVNNFQLPPNYMPGGWGIEPYESNGKPIWVPVGATGGAWAFTRYGFDTVGGLLDACILGHADWFMSFGLVSSPTQGEIAASKYHPNYTALIEAWQDRAKLLKKNINVVDQFAVHHWHGSKKRRGYGSRDQILVKYQFDPINDLRRNSNGLYELNNNKPEMRNAIREYFLSRNEDNLD